MNSNHIQMKHNSFRVEHYIVLYAIKCKSTENYRQLSETWESHYTPTNVKCQKSDYTIPYMYTCEIYTNRMLGFYTFCVFDRKYSVR